jgi:type II secretory pathway pseudopilin PulG
VRTKFQRESFLASSAAAKSKEIMTMNRNNKKIACISEARKGATGGFSLVELLVVVVIMMILSAISIPYIYNYKKLYKSEDQALKVMDLMREAGQLALTRRRTMRLEIDWTDKMLLIIDENGAGAGDDLEIKAIPLANEGEIRMDQIPTGLTAPNPPTYSDAVFAADTIGHLRGGATVTGNNVWAARFKRDGSVVNAAETPVSANLYIWAPLTGGSDSPRNNKEVRAITIFGGTGAVRYWKHDGAAFVPYQ